MSSEERAPLLANEENGDDIQPKSDDGVLARLTSEPLTDLSRLLIIASTLLLLLAAIFIGLFAGAEHRLSLAHGKTTTVYQTTTSVSTATSSVTTTRTTTTTKIVTPPTPKPEPKPETCTTPACVILAASILSGMNPKADPCEEFYEYSNGGWLRDHEIPSGKARYSTFDALSERNNRVIKGLLQAPVSTPPKSTDEVSLAKLKTFYISCTNETRLDIRGPEPLLEVSRAIRELFPLRTTHLSDNIEGMQAILGSGMKYDHDLTAVLSYLHSIDVPNLFEINIDGDAGVDPDFMTLWFSQSELGLPSKEYYKEEAVVEEYTALISALLFELDESSPLKSSDFWPPWPWPSPPEEPQKENRTAKAQRLSQDVFVFEGKLAKYGADLDTLLVDPIATYNPLPLANLTRHMPYMDFPAFVSSFAPRNFPTKVIVTYPPYAEKLSHLVSKTSGETLQAYFMIRAAMTLAPYLSINTAPWKAVIEFEQGLNGIKKGTQIDRQKWCLERVEESLGFMAGRFFVQEVFAPSARQKAFDVIHNIIQAFNNALPKLSWMAKKDRAAAAEKASALRIKVGYPTASPNTTDARSVAGYYNLVKVNSEDFFGNILKARTSDQVKKWSTLGKARNHETWQMFPSTVNAYYEPPANEIVFPAGILSDPFFGEEWPMYMNYGAIGWVAAHELTHAFDSSGRLYNQHGKLESWWSNSTSDAFDERKECLAKQYASYVLDDGKGHSEHVNGNLTSGENIGDSGVIHSWRAWKAVSNSTTNFLLPGLEHLTLEQLFFISFARAGVGKTLPAAAVRRLRTDPHSPPLFRVEGTVRNIPEFAKTFNCSAKAKLNPKQRCMFW